MKPGLTTACAKNGGTPGAPAFLLTLAAAILAAGFLNGWWQLPLPRQARIDGLKIIPQGFNDCGPANLSINLNFYGDSTTQNEAATFPIVVEKGYEPSPKDGWLGHYLTIFGYDDKQEFLSLDTNLGPWDGGGWQEPSAISLLNFFILPNRSCRPFSGVGTKLKGAVNKIQKLLPFL